MRERFLCVYVGCGVYAEKRMKLVSCRGIEIKVRVEMLRRLDIGEGLYEVNKLP